MIMRMAFKRSKSRLSPFFLFAFFFLGVLPLALAQEGREPDEASPSQAEATMASLFGRGAKMPGIPRIDGTIALPSFDSSGMTIDETTLVAAQQKRSE